MEYTAGGEKTEWKYEDLPGNDDKGLLVRLCSALPYLLPLLDAVPYGLYIAFFFPASLPFFAPQLMAYWMFYRIPFGSLICFFAMDRIAQNKELPSMLRFNLLQAVYLDLAICNIGLLIVLFKYFAVSDENELPAAIIIACSVLAFLCVASSVAYSVAVSLRLGRTARGIPWVSAAAERAMGITRPEPEQKASSD